MFAHAHSFFHQPQGWLAASMDCVAAGAFKLSQPACRTHKHALTACFHQPRGWLAVSKDCGAADAPTLTPGLRGQHAGLGGMTMPDLRCLWPHCDTAEKEGDTSQTGLCSIPLQACTGELEELLGILKLVVYVCTTYKRQLFFCVFVCQSMHSPVSMLFSAWYSELHHAISFSIYIELCSFYEARLLSKFLSNLKMILCPVQFCSDPKLASDYLTDSQCV